MLAVTPSPALLLARYFRPHRSEPPKRGKQGAAPAFLTRGVAAVVAEEVSAIDDIQQHGGACAMH